MRCWEYRLGAAYTSEFTQTFPKSGTGGVETIESLLWFEQGVGKGDATRYLVQIIDKPNQITALKVWFTPSIFLPVKCVAELIVKPG